MIRAGLRGHLLFKAHLLNFRILNRKSNAEKYKNEISHTESRIRRQSQNF